MSDVPPKLAGLKIEHKQDELRISWPILNRLWVVSILLGPLFAFLLLSESDPTKPPHDLCTIPIIILLLLGSLYVSLVSLFNRSVLQISQSELRVKHGPIPYALSNTFDSNNVKQIYVKLVQAGRSTSYAVYILTKNNLHEKFLALPNGKLALYLEEEIERFLGIKDQVVRGEWRPEPYLLE